MIRAVVRRLGLEEVNYGAILNYWSWPRPCPHPCSLKTLSSFVAGNDQLNGGVRKGRLLGLSLIPKKVYIRRTSNHPLHTLHWVLIGGSNWAWTSELTSRVR